MKTLNQSVTVLEHCATSLRDAKAEAFASLIAAGFATGLASAAALVTTAFFPAHTGATVAGGLAATAYLVWRAIQSHIEFRAIGKSVKTTLDSGDLRLDHPVIPDILLPYLPVKKVLSANM